MAKEISARELQSNFVKMLSEDWALLTAGTIDDFNTMTVSWGGIGELWNKDVGFIFVRPQRYTFEFIEKNDSIKNKEIQDLLNLSPQGSHLYIRKLIDKGIIKPQGKGRSTIYILNKQ